MKLISQALSTTGNKIRLALVAGTILVGGATAAASMGVVTNPIAPASQTLPQAVVQSTAATATPEPTNAPETTPEATTAPQNGSTITTPAPSNAPAPAAKPQMGKCRETNGDGSIKYDANEQPVTYDCPVTQPATPAPTPTPEATPVPDNSGTSVSNPNH